MMGSSTDSHKDDLDHDDEFPLPGFRFHPTDEELVGFYLPRKIGKKPIGIEIIKQIDIYKYDPWDLTKFSSNIGEKECFFFCKRGRKYKNSLRPNRVTGSGFWKATGIDKPVYSNAGEGKDCIGFKKTLVYYRGSAGKGTKTDWMMHEFRLPSSHSDQANLSNKKNIIASDLQFAEIWTLCRILKRNSSQRRCLTNFKQLSDKHSNGKSSKSTCITVDSNSKEAYIVFGTDSQNEYFWENKPVISYCDRSNSQFSIGENLNSPLTTTQPQPAATFSSDSGIWIDQNNAGGFFPYDENWDDFGSILELDQHESPFHVNDC